MKTLFTSLIALGVLAFGSTAGAALIEINDGGLYDGTVVGELDGFIAVDAMQGNSSPATEETWVNTILSPNDTATYTVKTDDVTYYNTDNNASTFAFSLLDSDPRPDYFLVKNATSIALFENTAYVGWGVFDMNQIGTTAIVEGEEVFTIWDMNLGTEGFTVSHVTEFTADGGRGLCNPNLDPTCLPAVPIPAAVWLFGSGLLGLVAVGRRKV